MPICHCCFSVPLQVGRLVLILELRLKRYTSYQQDFGLPPIIYMKTIKDFVVIVERYKEDINIENILQVPFIRKGLLYFLYLSTKNIGTTASKLCQISESIARTSNTEVNALSESIKRFVESFKCLKKNIGRNCHWIMSFLYQCVTYLVLSYLEPILYHHLQFQPVPSIVPDISVQTKNIPYTINQQKH